MHGEREREKERFSSKLYGMTTYPWSHSGGFTFICDIWRNTVPMQTEQNSEKKERIRK